jgi:hypothetical protein
VQTSYSLDPVIAKEGMIADRRSLRHFMSRLAEGAVKAGLAVFTAPVTGAPWSNKGGDPGSVYQTPSPAAALDVDAFITNIASAAAPQTLSGTALNGAVGDDVMYPPRLVTLTLSNHTDWDATNATLVGELDGVSKSVTIAIPNGGNATVTTTEYFDKITSLTIPAQTGAGGTATLGVAVLDSSVTLADFEGFAVFDPTCIPDTIPSQDQVAEYHDKDTISVIRKGALFVVPEVPASTNYGGAVFVRISGGQLGAVRHDADGGAAIEITGARFESSVKDGLIKIAMY